jgi:predicted Zn-dependent peptidase
MTLITPEGDDGAAEEILRAAKEHFEETAREIEACRKRLRQGEEVSPSELQKLRAQLKAEARLYYEEAQRLARELRKQAGIAGQFALDFDAARQEVGRRMARLRAAGGSGEVSR